ncbi:hypothetical protein LEP1GSC035_2627 [Leptospira noguchii str. 2007001578]|uniref:PF04536 family protein n=1 Tax=Leptospira noguchii str. 2007001578 TaxID=1049974 RepID=A0ABN0J482_9LEPT|nr:hypothetical protein LEP1GSC035_2627 [Leptospira noguchii str. 2007001578]
MIPKFREGNYFQGISDGIDAVMTKINGEELSQTNKIPKFFEVINEYSIYIFPTFVSIIVIISVLISIGIFGTIGLAGILIFIEYIWESIILGIGILILLILCFSMTVYLKKKMRRKSFWDYIIVSVYISLVIFGTIGLIGVLFFIGLISESIILGIGILILLILFFSMTGYLKEKIRRKSFWDYILFGATTSSSDSSRSGRSSSGSWGSSSSSSSSGSSWSGGGGSSGGGGASGSW